MLFINARQEFIAVSLKTAYQKKDGGKDRKKEDIKMMKELRQRTVEWLRKKFGDSFLYDDLCCKKTIDEVADYFIQNHSVDEIEEWGGLDYALESWTEEFTPAEEMEAMYNEKQIEMLQENACAAWQGRPCVYTEEEIWEAE